MIPEARPVNISPGVSVLSLFPHLNYKPWYALAEFVDNALQSMLNNGQALLRCEPEYRLRVSIQYDPTDAGVIFIRDNAAGIAEADYHRAFKTAQPPPDRDGLSRFGVGMKSAACWFARSWEVRTSALGEDFERSIAFDVETIVRESKDELSPEIRAAEANVHFTELTLRGLHNPMHTKTISKVKDHLSSIYRVFIREGLLELRFSNEELQYIEPAVLRASYFRSPEVEPVLWRKEIDLDFGQGLSARGFAALRQTASVSGAGFALFERRRLIQGSGDEGYRPERIFGKSNSYTYQRLFGELELVGFEVAHTKDGFRWGEDEETFLEFLQAKLDEAPTPLLAQAEGYRARPRLAEQKTSAEAALDSAARVIQQEAPAVLDRETNSPPDETPPPEDLPRVETVTSRVIDLEFSASPWRIELELTSAAVRAWIELADQPSFIDVNGRRHRRIQARMSLAHPFMVRFAGTDPERIEGLLRVGAGLLLAETAARDGGVRSPGGVRLNLNDLLRDALSKP
ncbi:MAG: ATP-binding protein [Chloroflexota bacterium]